jgi:LuxR family transcriptional regulator, maltose regulon positive regulatory protein
VSSSELPPTTIGLLPLPGPTVAVERTALIARLVGSRAQVSLVCGPAGAGKTVLVTSLASRLRDEGEAVAWVALDARDDDASRLWASIVTALRGTGRFAPSARIHDLVAPPAAVLPSFIDGVLAEVERLDGELWLVLDDVHELRGTVALASLEQLVHRAPPHLHLVLSSRRDPELGLARLRLDGRLLELRAADLAFTVDEVAACLAIQGLDLPSATVRTLHERTEGWVAGVRIAVLALTSPGGTADLIDEFDGDDHAVADYLVTEVLARIPEDTRRFLLVTGVCATLDVGLARHLTGRADAAELLARLERENAFTVRLGRGRDVYRYHELFRTFLRAELRRVDPAAERRLHGEAGRWLLAHGDPLHAMEHLIAAGDVAALADLGTGPGITAILDGRGRELTAILERLGHAARAGHPVALVGAAAAVAIDDGVRADRWLSDAGGGDPDPWGEADPVTRVLAATVDLARAQGTARLPGALARLETAWTGDAGVRDHDLLALHQRGIARLALGRYEDAVADLRRVSELARTTGRGGLELAARSQLAAALGSAGRLPEMRETAEAAVTIAERRGWGRSRAVVLAHLCIAWSAHLRGQDAEAQQLLTASTGVVVRSLDPQVQLSARGLEALIGRDGPDGHAAAVRDYVDVLRRTAGATAAPATVAAVVPSTVRLALDLGERSSASELVAVASHRFTEPGELALARATLAVDAGRTDAARRMLAPVVRGDERCHVVTTLVAALLLAAVLEAERGNGPRSHDHVVTALRTAAPLELRRPFLVERGVRPLLLDGLGRFGHLETFVASLLSREPNDGSPSEAERLTAAEVVILADLPSMLSVAEIAEARAVSVNTVKTHLRAIYRKLEVDNRRGAVTAARHRGLL